MQQLEFKVTKCPLCENYYGPYSMEVHLKNDHALEEESESYLNGYNTGRADGENAGYKQGYAAAPSPVQEY